MVYRSITIKDVIFGYIDFEDECSEIVDSDPIQRFRNIKSPISIHYVYPGAEISQFSHLLGTAKAAQEFMEYMNADEEARFKAQVVGLFSEAYLGPFVYSFDEILQKANITRNDILERIITRTEIRDHLAKRGYSYKDALMWINEGIEVNGTKINLLDTILSINLVDRLERDDYFTGLRYQIEHHRLFQMTFPIENKLALARPYMNNLEAFIFSANNLFTEVYYNPAIRSADLMYLELLDLVKDEFQILDYRDVDKYVFEDDRTLQLKIMKLDNSKEEYRRAKELLNDLRNSRLYPRVYEAIFPENGNRDALENPKSREELEERIAEENNIDPGRIHIDFPVRRSVAYHPERYEWENFDLFEKIGDKIYFKKFKDESPATKAIKEYTKIIRVYAPKEYASKIKNVEKIIQEAIF